MYAKDLNESHIGQRFMFRGVPVTEGELSGFVGDYKTTRRVKIVDCSTSNNPDVWSEGYFIDNGNTVIPLGKPKPEPEPSNVVRDKLANYIQIEFSARRGGRIMNDRTAVVLADIFTELMEGGGND